MTTFPDTIKPHCPACRRAIRVPLMREATTIRVRKCKCGKRWHIRIAPVHSKVPGRLIHVVTLTPISGEDP